ncbi:MAG: hypothetical protein H8D78_05120 [Chloroflexi bacterium]|nr:hypothetical protein [Chloroflexota bacterium]
MRHRCLFDLREARLPTTIGAKASNLRFLIKKGFRTPVTFVCTWDAYERYRE